MICTQRGGRLLGTIWPVTTKVLPGWIWNSDRTFCLSRSLCPHFGETVKLKDGPRFDQEQQVKSSSCSAWLPSPLAGLPRADL